MEDIFVLEEQIPSIAKIEINNVQIWSFLRIIIRFRLLGSKNIATSKKKYIKSKIVGLINRSRYWLTSIYSLLYLLFHFKRFLKKYEFVIFSSELEKKILDGKYIDKLSEGLFEILDREKILLIYECNEVFFSNPFKTKNTLPKSAINLLLFFIKKPKLLLNDDSLKYLDELENVTNKEIADISVCRHFFQEVKAYQFLFEKIWKPEKIFVSCYTSFPQIYSARKLNKIVVEFQHGIISKFHPGYESVLKCNLLFRPNYLLSFGQNSIRGISNNLINETNTFPIGSYYLEMLNKREKNIKVLKLMEGFKFSACIPIDFVTENEIFELLEKIAPRLGDTIFVIVPRIKSKISVSKFHNILIANEFSFQEIVRHCNLYTGTHSTCCLESLYFGIPNILLDFENRASDFFKCILDERFTYFVKNEVEYVRIFEKIVNEKFPKDMISNSNKGNYASNNIKSLKEFILKINDSK